ncbi:MAG: Fe-S cluster assembly scaffold protein NifU [bacterium (Candidatus Stahlbacteria) CG23_combo_of_CG06-09_8_20_14_all_34_7]|nr:MAG: Fe-S cluster assembly scaffold protein NifU [bacterium (Candidatus Stahlbacteria) CG23_combo_of_CG06-09_8_20_14_all_34_7]
MYNQIVMNHFRNPHNVGKMENPSGVGKVGNPQCGDEMVIYIKVENNVIVDVTFETFGCVAAIASSSVTTDLIKGKTIEEALALSNKEVADKLGGLPLIKIHCSVLAEDGIKAAIEDYRKREAEKKNEQKI